MQKTVLALLSVVFLLQLARLPALALDVIVHDNGSVYFYQGEVLGDDNLEEDDEEDEEELEVRENKTEEAREQEKKNREMEKKRIEIERENPVKIITKSQKSKIQVKTENNMVQVRMEGKNKLADVIENKRFRLELPAAEQVESEEEVESTDSASVKQSREERQERKEEKFEIQSEVADDGSIEFQFESRDVKAKLHGAEFTIDPTTNVVTLITPSGTVHHLNHLPDQAINNMIRAGVISGITEPIATRITDSALLEDATSSSDLDTASQSAALEDVLESELELEVTDDGSVVYTTTVKKPKKLLGLFRRDVLTKVELNDETGEISESEVQASTLIGQLLNFLSL